MGLPVSKGIGTGAAQVFEQDKTYQALQGMAGRKMQLDDYNARLEEQRRKEEKEDLKAKQEKAFNLQNAIKFNPKGMKPVDIDLSKKQFDELVKKYSGHWAEIADGGFAKNQFDMDWAEYQANIQKRVDSYDQYKNITNRMSNDPRSFTNEQFNLSEELFNTPDTDMSQYLNKFGKKLNIGNPNAEFISLYKDSFLKDDYTSLTDAGKNQYTGDRLRSEKETLQALKNNITPEWLEKYNALYSDSEQFERDADGNLTEIGNEQMLNHINETLRDNIKQSFVSVATTPEKEEEKEDEKDLGYNSKKWNANVQYNKDLKTNVVSFSPYSTSDSPLQLSGENIIVEGKEQPGFGNVFQIWVENGKVKARIAMTDNKGTEEEKIVNRVVTLQEDAVQRIKSIVGINTSIDNFLKSIKPESKTRREGDKQDRLNLGI